MTAVEVARDDVLEACRKLDITTVNMLEYARWYFRASKPHAVRRSRLKLLRNRARWPRSLPRHTRGSR